MNHDTLKNLIFQNHDGETSPAEAAVVRDHLALCAECRGALEAWRRVAAFTLSPSAPVDTEDFVRRVMARVAAEPEPVLDRARRWLFPAGEFPWVLAGAVALVLAVALAGPLSRPAPPPAAPASFSAESRELASEFMTVAGREGDPGAENIGTDIETYFL